MEKKQKKILIISQYFTPDITAAAYRMADMYEAICGEYDVEVLTSSPHKSLAEVEMSSDKIHRLKIYSKSRNKFLKYVNEYLGFMIKSLIKSKCLPQYYDYVFVTSPPIFVLFSGCIIARKKKAKLIIDIRDIWPDVLIDNGALKKNSPIYFVLKEFEKYIYRQADYVICVSRYMKQYIEDYSGRTVTVVYNGVSCENQGVVSGKNRTEKRLNLFYTGNLGFFQHLNVLFEAFEQYPELKERICLHIIGEGTELENYRTWAERIGTENIHLYGALNKEKTCEMTNKEADILFLNLYDSPTLQRTIPSKLFDYLSYNKPIVYGIKGEGKEILDNLGCGVFFTWDNSRSLKDALFRITDQIDVLAEYALQNAAYVSKHFSRKKSFKKYWDSIDE